MKIIRDGKEIELTDQELADACREWAIKCHTDDVECCLSEWCATNGIAREKIDAETLETIVDEYEDMLFYHEMGNRDELVVEAVGCWLDPNDYKEE